MTKTSKTILFFGNERIATGVTTSAPTLRRLVEAGYDIKAVVSNYERGQSRKARNLEIAEVAAEFDIPVLLPNKPADIIHDLASYGAQAAVLVAYGRIVPQSVIDIFPKGIINIHPSLLPLHRGPTPIESVMLAGDGQTGVSIMQLVKAMDAGPVYAQKKVHLTGREKKQHLADKLLSMGGDLLLEHLPAILDGSLVPTPQNESEATYDKLIAKQDGIIDWSQTAEQIERQIRSYAYWPGSHTVLAGKDVIITSAEISDVQGSSGSIAVHDKELLVHCGKDSLRIKTLKPHNKQEMPVEAFLAGYKDKL